MRSRKADSAIDVSIEQPIGIVRVGNEYLIADVSGAAGEIIEEVKVLVATDVATFANEDNWVESSTPQDGGWSQPNRHHAINVGNSEATALLNLIGVKGRYTEGEETKWTAPRVQSFMAWK